MSNLENEHNTSSDVKSSENGNLEMRKRRNDVMRIGLKLSSEEQDKEDHRRCQNIIDTLLEQSPMVQYLLTGLKKAQCPIDRQSFQCVPCDHPSTGFFSPSTGVSLCQNFIVNKRQVEETISHELIHAYDYCTREFDYNNCSQVACSEIRAAALSGDCRWINEFMRGHYTLGNQYKECVRRRALMSIESLPICKDKNPSKLIDSILDLCMSDTRPFIDIPY